MQNSTSKTQERAADAALLKANLSILAQRKVVESKKPLDHLVAIRNENGVYISMPKADADAQKAEALAAHKRQQATIRSAAKLKKDLANEARREARKRSRMESKIVRLMKARCSAHKKNMLLREEYKGWVETIFANVTVEAAESNGWACVTTPPEGGFAYLHMLDSRADHCGGYERKHCQDFPQSGSVYRVTTPDGMQRLHTYVNSQWESIQFKKAS